MPSSTNTPVVIASVPWTDTSSPLMAPAVLKSSLKTHGIDSVALDLNAEIKHWLDHHPCKDGLLKFMLTEQVNRDCKSAIKQMLDFMADRILAFNPQWIALSLLTYLSQNTAKWLCFRIRQKNSSVKIIVGGPGAAISLKSLDGFAASLKRDGLIDHFIVGDGEESLPALIDGRDDFPGVDSQNWQQLSSLNDRPWPDFSDYDWSLYRHRQVSIVGSRGCVRECTFCDIHEHWSKYQWRSGEDIFKEIHHQKEKYGINVFKFADSLVNGNQKEYLSLIKSLADYNRDRPRHEWIRWTGSFIVRPRDQMKEDVWKLTAESGAHILSVGIESFVEHIRYHIKKKFSNDDIDFALDMAKKYGIKLILLTIVGYVTETDEDFQQQLDWVEQHRHYAGDPVHSLQIGSGLGILEGTWLHRHHQELNVTLGDENVPHDWTRLDIGSTPIKRIEWHKRMQSKLRECGFTANYMQDNHSLIEEYLKDKYS